MSRALVLPHVWENRRVLITGHTGFKGSWLSVWLMRLGARVAGFALAPDTAPNLSEQAGIEAGMQPVRGDVRDARAVADAVRGFAPEIVFHLAAQPLVRRGYADPLGTFATNVMGTANVLEAARQGGARGVIVVSSDKCYANREWVWPYREDDALGGHDPYSASKACAELAAAAWRSSFPGMAIATARAGNVIGGGDWAAERLLPDCVRAFAAGEAVRLRHPGATRPWQHVLEPLAGYLLLAQRLLDAPATVAEAWNFGPDPAEAHSVGAVVEAFAALWPGARGWVREGEGGQPHEAGLLAVSAAKARAQLDWRPRLKLAEALEWTAGWYRRHREGAPALALMGEQIALYTARLASAATP